MELISREALIERFSKLKGSDTLANMFVSDVIREIKNQPPVDAVSVVHGKWTNEYINRYGHPCHCCSVCGFHASHQDKNFCPECGADMRKKEGK